MKHHTQNKSSFTWQGAILGLISYLALIAIIGFIFL